MNLVRFKTPYSSNTKRRNAYELVSDEPLMAWDQLNKKMCMCYATKLLGNVSVEKMEQAEEKDEPAINLFVQLSNL